MMSTESVDMEVDSNEVGIREEIFDSTIDEGIDISRETTLKKEKETCLRYFDRWSAADQTEFVEQLISRMGFHQHEHINSYLVPMLQRDFITALPSKCKCVKLKLCEVFKECLGWLVVILLLCCCIKKAFCILFKIYLSHCSDM